MEPLMSFTDEEDLTNDPPSPWVKITSSQCSKAAELEATWEQNCSRCWRAHNQGSFLMPCFMGCSRPLLIPMMVSTLTTTIPDQSSAVPNIFTQQVRTPPGSPGTQRQKPPPRFVGITTLSPKMETPLESARAPMWTPPPGFAEITSTLRKSQTSKPLLVEEQALPWLVGSTVVMSQVVQDMWGTVTINMMTCQLNVMGLGPTQPSSTVTIREMLAEMPILEDTLESEDWRGLQPPPSDLNSTDATFLHHW